MKIFLGTICLVIGLAPTACTSYQPAPFNEELLRQELALGNIVRPGGKARLTLTNGDVHKVRVTSVESDRLVTNAGTFALDDITSVDTREHDATRTWILLGGVLVGSYLLLEAASAIAFLSPLEFE